MTQPSRPSRTDAELLYQLTAFVRETTQEFFDATSRDDIEEIVRERFRDSELYTLGRVIENHPEVVLADHQQTSEAWTVSSKAIRLTDPTMVSDVLKSDQFSELDTRLHELDTWFPELDDPDDGVWTVVSLEAGRTIYGGLVIHANRPDAFGEGELAAIEWFGDTISQAINAVENRRLLFANAITEIRIDCPDTPLQAVAADASCRLSLESFVPTSDERILVYCGTTSATPEEIERVAESVEAIAASRTVGSTGSEVIEFAITDGSPLFGFVDGMANLSAIYADEHTCTVVAEIASGTCAVPTLDRIHEYCPDATLIAKRERNVPASSVQNRVAPPAESLETLTDRQRDVLEAAYRSGYFRWPRDVTAEEVAESLGISSPTLHKHLRRAEERLFEELLDPKASSDELRTGN